MIKALNKLTVVEEIHKIVSILNYATTPKLLRKKLPHILGVIHYTLFDKFHI